MTMTAPKYTALQPLEEVLADLDTEEAISDRRHRALEWAKRLEGVERAQMIHAAGSLEVTACYFPHLNVGWDDYLRPEAERMCGRNFDALVQRQCEAHLRRMDEQAVYADPDRMEEHRIWSAYCSAVSSIAFTKGDQSAEFVTRWQDLVRRRNEADEYGESTGAIDQRLDLMGVSFPKLPAAAWAIADTLGEHWRLLEHERLEQKYGPRTPDPTPTKRPRK